MKISLPKITSYLLIVAGLVLSFASLAEAKECHTVYGGGEVCESGDLSLDKKVYNPEAGAFGIILIALIILSLQEKK